MCHWTLYNKIKDTTYIDSYKVVAKNEQGTNETPFTLSVDGEMRRPQVVEEEVSTVLDEMVSESIPDSEEGLDGVDGVSVSMYVVSFILLYNVQWHKFLWFT